MEGRDSYRVVHEFFLGGRLDEGGTNRGGLGHTGRRGGLPEQSRSHNRSHGDRGGSQAVNWGSGRVGFVLGGLAGEEVQVDEALDRKHHRGFHLPRMG